MVVEIPVLFKKESPVEPEAGEGLVVVEEEETVENPNGDGEEAAAAPDKDDEKRDGVELADVVDEPKMD